MEEAVKSVKEDGKGPREAARAYNVPVETPRCSVIGAASMDIVGQGFRQCLHTTTT